MIEMLTGSGLFVIAVMCIAMGYILHMYYVFKDIAKQEAKEQADAMFDDYVHNCTYKVHTQLRIVDEMHQK